MNVAQMLGKEDGWHDRRRQSLGGSDANILMNGDPSAILRLWQEKRGEVEPEDLSDILPVQMGVWTEPFNVFWFEKVTGRTVQAQGESKAHSAYPFMACTLDGTTTSEHNFPAVLECKHVNAFSKIDDVAQKYMPQLHHNMAVTGLSYAILSVFIGTFTHEVVEVECDDDYLAHLVDRERAFWACVESGEPPADMAPVKAPAPPEKLRSVDMSQSNEWGQWAGDWLENKKAAKRFKDAEKELKDLMENDMGHAFGFGVQCKRAKNGSLRISEMKE